MDDEGESADVNRRVPVERYVSVEEGDASHAVVIGDDVAQVAGVAVEVQGAAVVFLRERKFGHEPRLAATTKRD